MFTHAVRGKADTIGKYLCATNPGIDRAAGDDDYMLERHHIQGSSLTSGHRGSTSKIPASSLATEIMLFDSSDSHLCQEGCLK